MKHLNLILIITFFFVLINNTYAQESLMITSLMEQEKNEYTEEWKGWPDVWADMEEEYGAKGSVKFTVLDNESTEYLVEFLVGDAYFSLTVYYTEYDRDKGWFVYDGYDDDDDAVKMWVEGANLTSLAINGWPDKIVTIYFWWNAEALVIRNI